MTTDELINNLMRQTTVLIGQISTAVGLRAPLAHVADQVFLSLSRELEAQGLSRKVAADMFGLALRSYQKKVARASEGHDNGSTIWEKLLQLFKEDGVLSRSQILSRFPDNTERVVVGVLGDLVSTGIVYCTGKGPRSVYGLTSRAAQVALSSHSESDAYQVWHAVYEFGPVDEHALFERLPTLDGADIAVALESLRTNGQIVQGSDGSYVTRNFVIPPCVRGVVRFTDLLKISEPPA
jgi:hypothetical protein